MSQESLDFAGRGFKPVTQWFIYSMLAFLLLIADVRFEWGNRIRSSMLRWVSPIQTTVSLPTGTFKQLRWFWTRQDVLVKQNQELIKQQAFSQARIQENQALIAENQELKNLLDLKNTHAKVVAAAEVVSMGSDPFSVRVTLNKGEDDGVQTGQAVVDADGLIGQITSVNSHQSLMTPVNHQKFVLPVKVERTGFRTLIYGETTHLSLRYVPTDADLRLGDVLITSGIDDNYPAGIPVARVVHLETADDLPYYRVQVVTLGHPDSARYVLVLPQTNPQSFRQPENAETTSQSQSKSKGKS